MKEITIQNDVRALLRAYRWKVMRMVGNAYQKGVPDLYATHKVHGPRWIEIKKPTKYVFTPDQLESFPDMEEHGAGIWILTAGTKDEYDKLFLPPNWRTFLKPKDHKRMRDLCQIDDGSLAF